MSDRHDAEERIRRVPADTLPLACDMSVAFVLTISWQGASPQRLPPFRQSIAGVGPSKFEFE